MAGKRRTRGGVVVAPAKKGSRSTTNTEEVTSPTPKEAAAAAADLGYEKCREERIKENLERMQKLGILHLSLDLKSQINSATPNGRRRKAAPFHSHRTPTLPSPSPISLRIRRSSRLQNADPVSYAEIPTKNDENLGKKSRLPLIEEGEREEIYTDEHAALLGNCETSWTLFVDGYDNKGKRIYDQIIGKTCHQCRQKTLGHHTRCSRCGLVQGQFCGDCLYMRYGENVLEVEKNPNWICPVCRGICNCSICRSKKGWAPTGMLYKKVLNLGFKSVAHYLIQTRRRVADSSGKNSAQTDSSLNASVALFSDAEDSDLTISLDSKSKYKLQPGEEEHLREKLVSVANKDEPRPLDPKEEPLLKENVLDPDSFEKNSDFSGNISKEDMVKSENEGRKIREPAAAAAAAVEKQEDNIADEEHLEEKLVSVTNREEPQPLDPEEEPLLKDNVSDPDSFENNSDFSGNISKGGIVKCGNRGRNTRGAAAAAAAAAATAIEKQEDSIASRLRMRVRGPSA